MIKAVIFDMDGVVADSTKCDFTAWRMIFSEFGSDLSFDTYKSFLGMKGIEIAKRYFPDISDDKAAGLQNKKEVYFIDCIEKEGLTATKGLVSFLDLIQKHNYHIALATAAIRDKAEAVLACLNLRSYFNVIVTSDDVSKGKPDPEMFLKAGTKLNAQPQECVVIEDAPNGVEAAKSGGMRCVAITTTHDNAELKEADLIIDSFDHLKLGILRSL